MADSAEQHRLAILYEQLRLKLLDLSRKNRMLNYSLGARSKRHLQIVNAVLEEVYQKLVDEEATLRIAFLPEPDDIPTEEKTEDFIAALEYAKVADIEYLTKLDALEREGRDDEIELAAIEQELRSKIRAQLGLPPRQARADINRADHARSRGIDPSLELPKVRGHLSHNGQSLQTLKYPDELENVTGKIVDQARLAEQEMGVSTLFLAFGFLEWYESDDSDKKAYAPLLLLPVMLEARKVYGRDVFYLSAREGAAEINLSLQKLLDQKHKRELPNFEVDDEGTVGSIESYLDRARAAIDGLKRWQVRRWLVLGHFAFGRFVIYSDLKPENWNQRPVVHPLVNALLSGQDRDEGGPLLPTIPDNYEIDDPEIEKIAPLLIHDADASQHSALIDVMREKNLVIQGPPGTGKSQTITNIIANALSTGKRILFLAEKRAALDVVMRRLNQAGLGEFCLELHSDKVAPKLVIESLKKRADMGWGRIPPRTFLTHDFSWDENRKEIASYLEALHAESPDGSTPFRLIWKALRGRTQNADVLDPFKAVDVPPNLLVDAATLANVRSRVDLFARTAKTFADTFQHPAHSPWVDAAPSELPRYEVRHLITTLTELQTSASNLVAYFQKYADNLGINQTNDIKQLIDVNGAIGDPPDVSHIESVGLACCRFRRHRVRCQHGTGGGLWSDGSSRGSSSVRL